MILKIKLIDVGRSKINKNVEIDVTKGLYSDSIEETLIGVVKHYLLSENIDVVRIIDKKNFFSVFAGFKKVGEIELLGDYIFSESGKVVEIII